jgi:hypothetical protein
MSVPDGSILECLIDYLPQLTKGQLYVSRLDWLDEYPWVTIVDDNGNRFTCKQEYFKILLTP